MLIDVHVTSLDDSPDTIPFVLTQNTLPTSWKEAARHLRIAPRNLNRYRKNLRGLNFPISREFLNELEECIFFCSMRSRGGGGDCTIRTYATLKRNQPERLKERLRELMELDQQQRQIAS